MPFRRTILLSSLLLCSAPYAKQPVMYKYTDQDGVQVISTTLPADAADRGYAVVSPRGNVIETVEPKLTNDQILQLEHQALEKEALLQAEKQNQIELEKQQRKDVMLLKMFSSHLDIERSRDEKIQHIEVQQAITKENLARLESQLEQAFDNQKVHQEREQDIPETLLDTITDTQKQIEDNHDFLLRKEAEKQQIKTQYQHMIERFKTLKPEEH